MPEPSHPPLPDHWLHILLALAEGERHGLDVMRAVHDATGGHLRLWPGKLYGALRELHARGWLVEIESAEPAPRGGNPRFYELTPAGRDRLRAELARLASILALAQNRNVLSDAAPTKPVSRRAARESRGRA
jgi:DNA-binding PadR family transcriptional regulator